MEDLLQGVLRMALLEVAALFPIVNPVGTAPIFLSLTRGASAGTRATLARRIAVNGFVLLVASMLVGSYILKFFGISLPVVQVAGGLVLTVTGWSLLTQPPAAAAAERTVPVAHRDWLQQSFYPLTLPLTVGPGSLSVAVTLGASASGRIALVLIATMLAATFIALTIYLSYAWSERLERLLGESAINVFLRLSSFLLLCIGVQILANGVKALRLF
ncbi:MAG TPA: MarC family protein [Vicinamibacterales bacterium]|nr:MarC family protein [Vicinamibacterales bacterium]